MQKGRMQSSPKFSICSLRQMRIASGLKDSISARSTRNDLSTRASSSLVADAAVSSSSSQRFCGGYRAGLLLLLRLDPIRCSRALRQELPRDDDVRVGCRKIFGNRILAGPLGIEVGAAEVVVVRPVAPRPRGAFVISPHAAGLLVIAFD